MIIVQAKAGLIPALAAAFDFFNKALFAGELPPTRITFPSTSECNLEIVARCWTEPVDEIGLYLPEMARFGVEMTLSIIEHEMAHLHRTHFGRQPITSTHDLAWCELMVERGLVPVRLGHDTCSHTIVPGGPFARAYAALLATGYRLELPEPLAVVTGQAELSFVSVNPRCACGPSAR